jgi:hypothetical protein
MRNYKSHTPSPTNSRPRRILLCCATTHTRERAPMRRIVLSSRLSKNQNCPIAPEPTPSGTGSTLFGFNLRRPNASGAKKLIEVNRNLALNKSITVTKKAKQKAWECFAIEEPGRANRGREYVESGLNTADFDAEDEGRPNDLPPWKKWKTNKLATAETLE